MDGEIKKYHFKNEDSLITYIYLNNEHILLMEYASIKNDIFRTNINYHKWIY